MSTLKRSALNNWLLRKANVKLLLTNIEEFYSDELNIASDAASVDIGMAAHHPHHRHAFLRCHGLPRLGRVVALVVSWPHVIADRVCKNEDSTEMITLIELILGAAIECENKKEYIENIMLLDESSQRILMVFIERVSSSSSSSPLARLN